MPEDSDLTPVKGRRNFADLPRRPNLSEIQRSCLVEPISPTGECRYSSPNAAIGDVELARAWNELVEEEVTAALLRERDDARKSDRTVDGMRFDCLGGDKKELKGALLAVWNQFLALPLNQGVAKYNDDVSGLSVRCQWAQRPADWPNISWTENDSRDILTGLENLTPPSIAHERDFARKAAVVAHADGMAGDHQALTQPEIIGQTASPVHPKELAFDHEQLRPDDHAELLHEQLVEKIQELTAAQKVIATQQETIADLRRQLNAKQSEVVTETANMLLLKELPDPQSAVLQAILELSDSAFAEAERLIGTLEGQPMTESFTNALKSLLHEKDWRVTCKKCGKPSMVSWHPNGPKERYREGGRGEFTHASPSPHGSLTKIRKLAFVKHVDQRQRID